MKITKQQYDKLLTYIGCGDLAGADIIFFGNEEGTGGNSIGSNIIARCDYFGKDKNGEYSDCVEMSKGYSSGYWQRDSQLGGEIVRRLEGKTLVDEKSGTNRSTFIETIGRMILALENQDVPVETWFKALAEKDEISNKIRQTKAKGLFRGGEDEEIKIGLMDWRPLPRPNESCTGEKWPSEYQDINEKQYLDAFNFVKRKKEEPSSYILDVDKRKQIIRHFFEVYPKRVVIGLGQVDVKRQIFEGIFDECHFEELEIANNTMKCWKGTVQQEGGELNIFLVPYPSYQVFPQGSMLSFYEELTSKYILPLYNEMNVLNEEAVVVNDYANNGKRYTKEEKQRLEEIAQSLETKQDMYQIAAEIALEFRRTEVAICKRIEDIKGWYWAQK